MEVVPEKILRNLPSELEFKESSMAPQHTGVWAKVLIKKGTTFGPFEGIKRKLQDVEDDTYSWEIRGPKGRRLFCIDATDPTTGNWMRYVKSARYYEEQNIIASQDKKSIFYKAMRDIPAGEELLCWFSMDYVPKISPQKEESSSLDTSTEPEPSTSPENDPLAIALGGIQITNVVSLASPESVTDFTTEHSSESTECKNRMPILEKIHAELTLQADPKRQAPIDVEVSPPSTNHSSCGSPPLISPVFSNNFGDSQVTNGRLTNFDRDLQVGNDDSSYPAEDVERGGDTIGDVELPEAPSSVNSVQSIQNEGNGIQCEGKNASNDESLQENPKEMTQFVNEPSVETLSITNGTKNELSGKDRSTGCMLRNPKQMIKKIDFCSTTKNKKNVLKCMTCSQIFPYVAELRNHFVNNTGPPGRRRRRFKKGNKRITGKTFTVQRGITRQADDKETVRNNVIETRSPTRNASEFEPLRQVGLASPSDNSDDEDVQQYSESVPRKGPFQCELCELSFDNREMLNDHIQSHCAGEFPYKCKICKMETKTLAAIHAHFISHQSNGKSRKKHDERNRGRGSELGGSGGWDDDIEAVKTGQRDSLNLNAYPSEDVPANSQLHFRRRKQRTVSSKLQKVKKYQNIEGTVMNSSEARQRKPHVRRKRKLLNKIYPCSLCNKLFSSTPNVYRHKRVVHGIAPLRIRRRRSKLTLMQQRTNASEISLEQNVTTMNDPKEVSSSSQYSMDSSSAEGTAVGPQFSTVPANVLIANLQSPQKVFTLGGRRLRSILPAPTTCSSAGTRRSVSSTVKRAASSLKDSHCPSHQNVNPVWSLAARPNDISAGQHLKKHPEYSLGSQAVGLSVSIATSPVKANSTPSTDSPGGEQPYCKVEPMSGHIVQICPASDSKLSSSVNLSGDVNVTSINEDSNTQTYPGVSSIYQGKNGNYQYLKAQQFSMVSPQYANTPADQGYPRLQIRPNSASPVRSPNEGTPASQPLKKESQTMLPLSHSFSTDQIAAPDRPRPYIPKKGVSTASPSSAFADFDKFGAMNLATKRTFAQSSDDECALDLTVHKRMRLANVDDHPALKNRMYQSPEQTVPLDLSKKSGGLSTTFTHSGYSERNTMSPQLMKTLEVVNAHAAMQVKSRGLDLKKVQVSSSYPGKSDDLVPEQNKAASFREGRIKSGLLDSSHMKVPPPPNFTCASFPREETKDSFQMYSPRQTSLPKDAGYSETTKGTAALAVDNIPQTKIFQVSDTPISGGKMDFACNVCGMAFHSMKLMNTHVVEHANDWPYKCEFCVFLFQNLEALAVHRTELHHVKKMYACSVCHRNFGYLSNLQKHQQDIHGMKEYVYKELDPKEPRPQNFTDPRKADPQQAQTNANTQAPHQPRLSFIAQEMSKISPLKIGKLTIPIKATSPGASPVKNKAVTRKHVPFNPQRHHPFAHARQIGYLSMLADPKNQELSATLVNRCTKCEKEFDCVADFHKHIMECAAAEETKQTGFEAAEGNLERECVADSGIKSVSSAVKEKVLKSLSSKFQTKLPQQTSAGRTTTATKRQRAKPGLKIYNPMKYSRREPAANMDDILTCHGCGKKFYFINRLERHMRMCPNRDKLKRAEIIQVRLMTKKTEQTLINCQHQCPFCKHHYTYLKSLKKHVLVCQFRPADVEDPLKFIEDSSTGNQKEVTVAGSSIGEANKVMEKEQSGLHTIMEQGTSTKDSQKEGEEQHEKTSKDPGSDETKKRSRMYGISRKPKRPMISGSSTDEEMTSSSSADNENQASTLPFFSLRLRRMKSGPSRRGKKKLRDAATWSLTQTNRISSDSSEATTQDQAHEDKSSPEPLKKYPIRERSPSVAIGFGELSHLSLRFNRPRGRGMPRGRGRGGSLGQVGGISPHTTGRGRGRGRSRGRGRGRRAGVRRGTTRGGHLTQESRLMESSDEATGNVSTVTCIGEAMAVTDERVDHPPQSSEKERLLPRGRGRGRGRRGFGRGRGLGQGRGRGRGLGRGRGRGRGRGIGVRGRGVKRGGTRGGTRGGRGKRPSVQSTQAHDQLEQNNHLDRLSLQTVDSTDHDSLSENQAASKSTVVLDLNRDQLDAEGQGVEDAGRIEEAQLKKAQENLGQGEVNTENVKRAEDSIVREGRVAGSFSSKNTEVPVFQEPEEALADERVRVDGDAEMLVEQNLATRKDGDDAKCLQDRDETQNDAKAD